MAGLELRAPQRQAQHLAQLPDEVDLERFPHVVGEILEVGFVLHGDHDGGDARADRTEHLLLDPADREHAAARISDRKSTRLNSSHGYISYAVFCLKKK